MRAGVALTIAVAACGGTKEPSAADKERARAAAACDRGDGPSCFVVGMGLDYTNQAQLRRAMAFWGRGCELGHAASCAQLGTVAEFGMTKGGSKPDPITAQTYYRLACKYGDAESCKRAGMPLPEGVADPDRKTFPWREALTPVCGKHHGELGPLFDGLVLGQPMPEAMKQEVAAFENKYKARVHYYPGDGTSSWSLDVNFPEPDGASQVLVAGWGKPDRSFGAWTSETTHVIAYWLHNDRESGVGWGPYRSVAEVIAPGDTTKLGFEPFPVLGAKLADLRAALGPRLVAAAEHEYRWNEIGPGPAFEVDVVEKHGTIVELRTQNWITSSPEVGDALLAALDAKWSGGKIGKNGVHTWMLSGRRVQARKPAGGNFEIVISKR